MEIEGVPDEAVVDSNDQPKAKVRVQFFGPDRKVLVTNSEGKFKVSLKDGTYRVKITDGKKSMEFENVPVGGNVTREFKLLW